METLIAQGRMASLPRRDWTVPAALLALAAVPLAAGVVRLAGLAAADPITAHNARFIGAPLPVVIHIFGATLFCVLGAFQFAARFRQRNPGWHRLAGCVAVPCGLLAGLSGVWMALSYPIPPELQGALLQAARVLFGSAMLLALTLALAAIRRGDIAGHRAWMVRGYAIGQAAGTQVLIVLPWIVISGEPRGVVRDVLLSAAWVINLAVAEWLIRRRAP